MALPRLAFRAFRSARPSARTTSARTTFQRTSRRTYAAGAAPETQPGSDLPWAIGSLAITLPAAYFLMQPSSSSAPSHVPSPAHEAQQSGHAVEVTQPTPQKVESQIETAVKSEAAEQQPEVSAAEQEGVQEKAENKEEQDEKKSAQPGMTEEKSAEEAKAEKSAEAPGEHAVVPDTAVQSTEAPSKKPVDE